MTIRKTTAMVAAITMLSIGACAKKAPEVLPPAPDGTSGTVDPGNGNAVIPGSQQDFVANISSDRIYFGFDQYNVDAEDMTTLQSQAAWLRRYPAVRALIEGHADERGTRDYNLALGERRANAARNYLASQGIDSSRLEVISYGKERPAELGSNEEAWAKNRRAVTIVIAR